MLKLLGIILALACGIAFVAACYINRRRLFDAPDVESTDEQPYVFAINADDTAALDAIDADARIQEQARWN